MKNNIECEVIRDLFPSYIDGLTSEVTNKMIEEHLSSCKSCSEILKDMESIPVETLDKEERKIDYLKKVKKANRRKTINILLSVILIVSLIGMYVAFHRGTSIYSDSINPTQISMFEGSVQIGAALDKDPFRISHWEITEKELENGSIELTVNFRVAIKSGMRQMTDVYLTEKKIERIKFGDRVVWENGKSISTLTNQVYKTCHEFIGDAPANNKSALAIGLGNVLGEFENELQTEEKPYIWKIKYPTSYVDIEDLEKLNSRFQKYGILLLGLVGNMDKIEFEYWTGLDFENVSVTKDEATEFLGFDVKKCQNSIYHLQLAMEKTGFIAEEGPEISFGTME